MIELKIKQKYFEAILKLEKPFEIRHKKVKTNEIVKLIELNQLGEPTGNYLIFQAGRSQKINDEIEYHCSIENGQKQSESSIKLNPATIDSLTWNDKIFNKYNSWYDEFCWQYISKKQSYIIPIAKILAVELKKQN